MTHAPTKLREQIADMGPTVHGAALSVRTYADARTAVVFRSRIGNSASAATRGGSGGGSLPIGWGSRGGRSASPASP
ncbi:MAG: hypothetical protein OXN84_17070 [Albidovulum sp.]|nr:hypothetical protein [Albidovulum sp.]